MSVSGIQGYPLEITVVGCSKLKDTEWISRQDPYVYVEYGSSRSRTRTCTDGGRNPTFQEKFVFSLIEGLREINITVWNSNTLTYDDFIGSGKVQLQKVLSQGFDDSSWPLQSKSGRHAGEVRLIMHYAYANKSASSFAPSAPRYGTPIPQVPMYSAPPPVSSTSYAPPFTAYMASPYPSYPSAAYPPPQSSAYPPQYPPHSTYPPPVYPPPQGGAPHYPPGPPSGLYTPPPY